VSAGESGLFMISNLLRDQGDDSARPRAEPHPADDAAGLRRGGDRLRPAVEDRGGKADTNRDRVGLASHRRGLELDVDLEAVGGKSGVRQEIPQGPGGARADRQEQELTRGAADVAAALLDLAIADDGMTTGDTEQALLIERSDLDHFPVPRAFSSRPVVARV
jgi:hypothetical protein